MKKKIIDNLSLLASGKEMKINTVKHVLSGHPRECSSVRIKEVFICTVNGE